MLHGEYDLSKDWTGYFSYGLRNTKMEYFYNNFSLSGLSGAATMKYSYNNQINKADSAEAACAANSSRATSSMSSRWRRTASTTRAT